MMKFIKSRNAMYLSLAILLGSGTAVVAADLAVCGDTIFGGDAGGNLTLECDSSLISCARRKSCNPGTRTVSNGDGTGSISISCGCQKGKKKKYTNPVIGAA